MAYTFDVNTGTTSAGGAIMFRLKQALITSGWTVLTSGSGTSGVYGPASDVITTNIFDTATRSWFVIKHPVLALQICLQCTTATTAWRIKVSASAGFIGGSPNNNTVPSASDEFTILGSNTDASPVGGALLPSGTNLRGNVIVGGSEENYAFFLMAHTSGTGGANGTFWFDPMQNGTFHPEDSCPFVIGGAGSSGNLLTLGHFQFSSYSAVVQDAAGTNSWRALFPLTYLCNTNTQTIPSGLGTDVITGGDLVFPIIWARYGTTGSGSANGPAAWKGFGSFFQWLGQNRTFGDTLSINGGTKNYLVVGSTSTTSSHVIIPWNGSDLTI